MNLEFNFVVDAMIRNKIYPALARHQAEPYTQSWREFGNHWPYTTPLRIQEYCESHGVRINTFAVDYFPANSFYPICLGFFDFGIDYFDLLPVAIQSAVRDQNLLVLFFYHEGDNPERIKQRLDELIEQHQLPSSCYRFVSANSKANELPGFVTFHDFEFWYYQRNIDTPPFPVQTGTRSREFVCLNRTHKWWRATALADLHRLDLLSKSYWSYCEAPPDDKCSDENPIEIDTIGQLRWYLTKFIAHAPYFSDELSQDQRNNHALVEPKYFTDAYCHIVLESQFDLDQSGGVFITEKTFKPIKHGQMFFVAGGVGSLQTLRDLGYRVFDHVLDNSYDLEPDHTQRWIQLTDSITKAQQQGIAQLFDQCQEDLIHNQQLFLHNKASRLNTLLERLK
jgi:hypothetical protein